MMTKNFWIAVSLPLLIKRISIFLLVCFFIKTCIIPPTDEDRVDRLNSLLEPEGHFTNTHFIVRWPALKGTWPNGRSLNAKPLTLKIPLEYLYQEPYLKKPKANPVLRVDQGLPNYTIRDGGVNFVSIHITYDAKPVQSEPHKHYTDEEWEKVRADKQQMDDSLKKKLSHFHIDVYREVADFRASYQSAVARKSDRLSDGFYVTYHANTPSSKCCFQVHWDLHGHGVVLSGGVAPLNIHRGHYYGDDLSPFPIDKTNPEYQYTELEDWRDIAIPARDLLESFVVYE